MGQVTGGTDAVPIVQLGSMPSRYSRTCAISGRAGTVHDLSSVSKCSQLLADGYGRARPLDCVFCDRLRGGDFIVANEVAAAFLDAFPLSEGHCLVVPRRHEPDFLALTKEELASIWALVPAVRRLIEAKGVPAGYNMGINVGEAAGQTVGHAHLHVIPQSANQPWGVAPMLYRLASRS